ncbi:MAG: peptidoglycan bridge formation glycyltransferase FemA/FemB family protein [Campylobacteraceae bacterium]|nr:peptidoglycan bridge formation glycyltransferase FemA/FemB family protein [Campylobacteraceae bacterium]
MVEVKVIEDKNEWNSKLKKTINYNVFSTYEWGEYKRANWEIERLAFYKSGNFLGQCQFLLKKKFGFLISWNSGGLNLVDYKFIDSIVEAIKNYYKYYKYNIRFNFYDKNSGETLFKILYSLKEVDSKINSGFSIVHSLKSNIDLVKSMSSNHRYYYKKSCKNPLEVRFNSENRIKDFIYLHNQMTTLKKLSHLKITEENIDILAKNFKENFLIESVYFNNKIVASCIILIFEDYAFYYLAASNEEGRRLFASYFMVKELFEYLITKDIVKFDFAGITPYEINASGVNKFKIGFGGEITKYVGEYELFNNKITNTLFNKLISFIK